MIICLQNELYARYYAENVKPMLKEILNYDIIIGNYKENRKLF